MLSDNIGYGVSLTRFSNTNTTSECVGTMLFIKFELKPKVDFCKEALRIADNVAIVFGTGKKWLKMMDITQRTLVKRGQIWIPYAQHLVETVTGLVF